MKEGHTAADHNTVESFHSRECEQGNDGVKGIRGVVEAWFGIFFCLFLVTAAATA